MEDAACRRCRNLPTCPRCLFPARNSAVGHCKRTTPDRIFNCARRRANGGLSGRSGGGGAGGAGADPPESRVPLPDSINPRRRIDIGNIACPNLFTAEQLDAEQGIVADGEVMEGPATQEDGSSGSLTDVFVPPLFWAVSTPEELQEALLAGPTHILITAHLDMTTVQTNVMKPESKVAVGMKKIFTLKNAVGRLRNTTFSIAVRAHRELPPTPQLHLQLSCVCDALNSKTVLHAAFLARAWRSRNCRWRCDIHKLSAVADRGLHPVEIVSEICPR